MLNRLGKVHILDLLYKGECRAARLAAKAIKHALGGGNGKGGRFFAVEGTSANQIGARPFERNVTTDELFNVGSVDDLLYEIFGESHGLPPLLVLRFVKNFDAL
jgi:hypothetical protein